MGIEFNIVQSGDHNQFFAESTTGSKKGIDVLDLSRIKSGGLQGIFTQVKCWARGDGWIPKDFKANTNIPDLNVTFREAASDGKKLKAFKAALKVLGIKDQDATLYGRVKEVQNIDKQIQKIQNMAQQGIVDSGDRSSDIEDLSQRKAQVVEEGSDGQAIMKKPTKMLKTDEDTTAS